MKKRNCLYCLFIIVAALCTCIVKQPTGVNATIKSPVASGYYLESNSGDALFYSCIDTRYSDRSGETFIALDPLPDSDLIPYYPTDSVTVSNCKLHDEEISFTVADNSGKDLYLYIQFLCNGNSGSMSETQYGVKYPITGTSFICNSETLVPNIDLGYIFTKESRIWVGYFSDEDCCGYAVPIEKHDWTFTFSGDTLSVYCINYNCEYHTAPAATITIYGPGSAENDSIAVYDGTPKSVSCSAEELVNWNAASENLDFDGIPDSSPQTAYFTTSETGDLTLYTDDIHGGAAGFGLAPTKPGTYLALTQFSFLEEENLEKQFTIIPADIDNIFFEEPVVKAREAVATAVTIPEGAKYTDSVKWNPEPDSNGLFNYNTTYTATVTLEVADSSYQFGDNSDYSALTEKSWSVVEATGAAITFTKSFTTDAQIFYIPPATDDTPKNIVINSIALPKCFESATNKDFLTAFKNNLQTGSDFGTLLQAAAEAIFTFSDDQFRHFSSSLNVLSKDEDSITIELMLIADEGYVFGENVQLSSASNWTICSNPDDGRIIITGTYPLEPFTEAFNNTDSPDDKLTPEEKAMVLKAFRTCNIDLNIDLDNIKSVSLTASSGGQLETKYGQIICPGDLIKTDKAVYVYAGTHSDAYNSVFTGKDTYGTAANVITKSEEHEEGVLIFCRTACNSKNVTVLSKLVIGGVTYKVEYIAADAFAGCKKLKNLTIGKYVKFIAAGAVNNCPGLKKITVGRSVEIICDNAFSDNPALATVIINSKKLRNGYVGSNIFDGAASDMTIYARRGRVKRYRKLFPDNKVRLQTT